ncbi:hypothetical protein Dimus_020620 [Dionaea muscipula]
MSIRKGITGPKEKCESSAKFQMLSDPSTSEQAYCPQSTITPKPGQQDRWLSDDGFPSVSINLHFHVNSFHLLSEYDHASLLCDAWGEDSVGGILPGLQLNSHQSIDISKHDTSLRLSPPADPALSFYSVQSFNPSLSSDASFGKSRPGMHQDGETSVISSDLPKVVGSHGHVDLPTSELSGEENVSSNEGDKLESQLSEHAKWAGSCCRLSKHGILKDSRHWS